MAEIIYLFFIIITTVWQIPGSFSYRTFTNETFKLAAHLSAKGKDGLFTYNYDQEALRARVPEHPIHPMILGRRSIYECTGERMTDEELFPLFEALRWGPSNFNTQPWRIVYAHHGTTRFEEFLNLVTPGNKVWNKNSSVLMIILANMFSEYEGKQKYMINEPMATGLGFAGMALEGTARGFMVHALDGFDRSKAAKALGIDKDSRYMVILMVAIGKPEPSSSTRRVTQRKPLDEFISKDNFKSNWIY